MLASVLNNQQLIVGGDPPEPATGRRIGRGFFRSAAALLAGLMVLGGF